MSSITEIRVEELDPKTFIQQKVTEIRDLVGINCIISAASGGVDSWVTTELAYRAVPQRLRVFFIDTGLMRKDEAQCVADSFRQRGIPIEVIDAEQPFLAALHGIVDPEQKREAVCRVFYDEVFRCLAQRTAAQFVLQGTIYSDIEMATLRLKRHHNVLTQLGIDTLSRFGYRLIEPLVQLRKDGVKKIANELGLPPTVCDRMPFPGPGLAIRVLGEVDRDRIAIVREANAIVEEELATTSVFQCLAVLHADRVVGIKDGKRVHGLTIEVRARAYVAADQTAPLELDWVILRRLCERLSQIPQVVSVVYNITPRPPCSIEAE